MNNHTTADRCVWHQQRIASESKRTTHSPGRRGCQLVVVHFLLFTGQNTIPASLSEVQFTFQCRFTPQLYKTTRIRSITSLGFEKDAVWMFGLSIWNSYDFLDNVIWGSTCEIYAHTCTPRPWSSCSWTCNSHLENVNGSLQQLNCDFISSIFAKDMMFDFQIKQFKLRNI